tara:strand:- start:559 stop:675 length:117 start_codon:yes stop_codon:yes gene_type:complete
LLAVAAAVAELTVAAAVLEVFVQIAVELLALMKQLQSP